MIYSEIDPLNEILVTNGAYFALYSIFQSIINPGDEGILRNNHFFWWIIYKFAYNIYFLHRCTRFKNRFEIRAIQELGLQWWLRFTSFTESAVFKSEFSLFHQQRIMNLRLIQFKSLLKILSKNEFDETFEGHEY